MNIPPFKLERYFAKYEFSTRYLLCSSDCESMSAGELLALEAGSEELFRQHWLGYTESQGAPSLRREICRIYATIQPDQILVHSGAEEAIFLFMNAVLQAGEHVVVHSPCYQSLAEIARSLGCEVTPWQARESRAWALDVDELRQLIRSNTRAVILNTPHNPTGYLMSQVDFTEVNRLTRKHGIYLFSDEVYREMEYMVEERLPAACDVNDMAVSLGVLSKTYGLAGLRIGWIATRNTNVFQKMVQMKDYTTICNSAPSEFLAELALRKRDKLVRRNLEIIRANLRILDDFFTRHQDLFAWQPPRAGSIAFPRFLGGDIDNFCDGLVREAGVLLLPGTQYDDHENHFRIGFGRRNMPQAVQHLEEFLVKQWKR